MWHALHAWYDHIYTLSNSTSKNPSRFGCCCCCCDVICLPTRWNRCTTLDWKSSAQKWSRSELSASTNRYNENGIYIANQIEMIPFIFHSLHLLIHISFGWSISLQCFDWYFLTLDNHRRQSTCEEKKKTTARNNKQIYGTIFGGCYWCLCLSFSLRRAIQSRNVCAMGLSVSEHFDFRTCQHKRK